MAGEALPQGWAIDADGAPLLAVSKEEAMRQTRALQGGGLRNIDVGCFQISLLNHPDAFADLEQAFDQISEELRSQYTLGYYPTNTARDGKFRKIKVDVSNHDDKVLARSGAVVSTTAVEHETGTF